MSDEGVYRHIKKMHSNTLGPQTWKEWLKYVSAITCHVSMHDSGYQNMWNKVKHNHE